MIVDCAHYKQGKRQHDDPLTLDNAAACERSTAGEFVWVGMHEPSAGELNRVGELFGLHELALEDAHMAHQRAKLEDYDDSRFAVLRTAGYDEAKEQVDFGEIHLFVGKGYLIAVRHGDVSELRSARVAIESRPDLLKLGPAAALWAILDKVVDDYRPVVDGIEDDIGEVEHDVFDGDTAAPTERIYFLKREVIEFNRAVTPLIGPLDSLQAGIYPEVPEELRRFYRDVYDHAQRIVEQITAQRELLTSVLEANLALVSVNQNEVIKRISAYAGMIAVPTFIASVYGMNFKHMPELNWVGGYPLSLVVMFGSLVVLHRYFTRAGWL